MSAIRTAVKLIAPLVVVMALMAVPSLAAAEPYWGEYDYEPLGGSFTSEDPVTADVSGTIEVVIAGYAELTCDVEGEVELANDWDHSSGSPARNQFNSFAPVLGSVMNPPSTCTAVRNPMGQSCPYYTEVPSGAPEFSGFPWAGGTDSSGWSSFADFDVEFDCYSGGWPWSATGTMEYAYPNLGQIAGTEQGDCLAGWSLYGDLDPELNDTWIEGEVTIDPESVEGLSTDGGGPCITLNY